MNQALASRLSAAVLDWRAAEAIGIYEFPFAPKPKSAGKDHAQTQAIKDYMTRISEITTEIREQHGYRKLEGKHLGCRIFCVVLKRGWDWDNVTKPIWDGMKNLAFGDDRFFDYLEELRIRAEDASEQCIVVEVFEQEERRAIWQ